MRVLAAYTNQGWIQSWVLPADPAADPETAYISGGPFAAAFTVAYKGRSIPWETWAASLARRSPYGFWFAVVDVPDTELPTPTAGGALAWLRSRDGLLLPAG